MVSVSFDFLFKDMRDIVQKINMEMPRIVQFTIQSAPEGGYTAEAVGYSIYTEGDTLDETIVNIQEAVECHFGEEKTEARSLPIMVNYALPAMA